MARNIFQKHVPFILFLWNCPWNDTVKCQFFEISMKDELKSQSPTFLFQRRAFLKNSVVITRVVTCDGITSTSMLVEQRGKDWNNHTYARTQHGPRP